jgi:hypothetical protein
MAVNFPSTPTNGQQLVVGDKTYTYDSTGGVWNITGGTSSLDVLYTRSEQVATEDQTTFNVSYSTDYPVEVFVNGLQYLSTDYTATNGTSIILDSGIPSGSEIVINYATATSSLFNPSSVSTSIIPNANEAYDLGDSTHKFRDLYLSGNSIILGDTTISASGGELQVAATGETPAPVGGGVSGYATTAEMPLVDNALGDTAFVAENNRLYVWNGSGWYSVGLINTAPSITTGGAGSYELATNGTPTVITLDAEDPEGLPITWSYSVTSGTLGGTTVSQADNEFTITPSTDVADQGEFTITFTASDGVNIATDVNSFDLSFLHPLWDKTVLSIGTSSTDGLDNSTFVDRSTNAHTVTPTGTPIQTAFHPYLDRWSTEFNAAIPEYLKIDGNGVDLLGSGDFTVEAWAYLTTNFVSTNTRGIVSQYPASGAGTNNWILGFRENKVRLFYTGGSSAVSTSNISLNKWYHVAWTRSGTTNRLFLDGVEEATFEYSGDYSLLTDAADQFEIGTWGGGTTNSWGGFISNVRIVKGTAVYTSNFTPDMENLTAISGTQILACQSNRIIDNSPNNYLLTINNGVKISSFNPFGQGSEYTVGENKGSVYATGDSTQVYVPGGAWLTLDGEFDISFWYYSVDLTTERNILLSTYHSPSAGWIVQTQTDGAIDVSLTGDGADIQGTAGVIKNYSWHHIRFSRTSGVVKVHVDGVEAGSLSTSGTFTYNSSLVIGNLGGNRSGYNNIDGQEGYISDFVFKRTAPVSYDVPTSPVGNSGAELYLPFDNAGIFDKTGNHNLTLFGDTSTSTTQTVFADTSISFDGSGDYIRTQTNGPLSNAADYTVEYWIYWNALKSNEYDHIWENRLGGEGFAFYGFNGGYRLANNTAGLSAWGSGRTTGQWYHHACVWSNGSMKIYIDGTLVHTHVDSRTMATRTGYMVNVDYGPHQSNFYIENFQVSQIEKYTTNFTPPTKTQGRTYQAES